LENKEYNYVADWVDRAIAAYKLIYLHNPKVIIPQLIQCNKLACKAMFECKHIDTAAAYLSQAIYWQNKFDSIYPKNVENITSMNQAYYFLGTMCLQIKDYEAALGSFVSSVDVVENNPEIEIKVFEPFYCYSLLNLSNLLIGANQIEKAKKYYVKAEKEHSLLEKSDKEYIEYLYAKIHSYFNDK